jgi:hypothetical protein
MMFDDTCYTTLQDGSGAVAYGDFVLFYNDAEPWYRSEAQLSERFAKALEDSSAPGQVTRLLTVT